MDRIGSKIGRPKSEFCKRGHARTSDNVSKSNACAKTIYTRWYQANGDKTSKYRHYKNRYGITLQQYNDLFAKQNGLCAICHKPETEVDSRTNQIRSLHVDHDHATEEIRGLLCGMCNKGIGCLQDSPVLIRNAAVYLENPPGRGFFNA